MNERGIIFTAAGERYEKEADAAALRIAEIWPEVPVTIFKHKVDDRPVQTYRMKSMMASPYEYTINMDTDTWLVDPVPELFEVLEHFDCALPMATIRNVYPLDLPSCFYNFNPGVFAYKMSPRMHNFFLTWERTFDLHHKMHDGRSHSEVGWFHSQPSFTLAMYHSTLRIAPLGQEYNWVGTGYVQERVKIIHKRPDPKSEAKRINQVDGKPRTALLYGKVWAWL